MRGMAQSERNFSTNSLQSLRFMVCVYPPSANGRDTDCSQDQLLIDSAKIYHLEDASKTHRQSVANLLWNDGGLETPDREYIQHIDDLICLHGDNEDTWVHKFVSGFLAYFGPRGRVRNCSFRFEAMSATFR